MSKEWGVVDQLEVRADTFKSLVAALTIAMTYHGTVTGWNEEAGALILYGSERPANKFITPMTDPEKVAEMVWTWLLCTKYPKRDEDEEKGYHLKLCLESQYITYGAICTIAPYWIYYSP